MTNAQEAFQVLRMAIATRPIYMQQLVPPTLIAAVALQHDDNSPSPPKKPSPKKRNEGNYYPLWGLVRPPPKGNIGLPPIRLSMRLSMRCGSAAEAPAAAGRDAGNICPLQLPFRRLHAT